MPKGFKPEGSGRKKLPAGSRIVHQVRCTPTEKTILQEALQMLRDGLLDANPVTEVDKLIEYAGNNGIHTFGATLLDFLSRYHQKKYTLGWDQIISEFKKEGRKRFERAYQLEMSDVPCKWCGKSCFGSCNDAKNWIRS